MQATPTQAMPISGRRVTRQVALISALVLFIIWLPLGAEPRVAAVAMPDEYGA